MTVEDTATATVQDSDPITPGDQTETGDFEPAEGTLTFAAGETSKTVSVTVNTDVVDEADETFFVDLSEAVNASLTADGTDDRGVGTIANDDEPVLSVGDVDIVEGDTGTVDATFTVDISNASNTGDVTVDWITVDDTATAVTITCRGRAR